MKTRRSGALSMESSRPPKRFKKVYIEIGDACNLRCGFCPGGETGRGLMGPGLFERAVAGVAPLAEQAYFHLLGEPLAHPRFAECVALCAGRGLPVNITTNGTLLDSGRERALLDPIVRQVSFSLHSLATLGAARAGAALEDIIGFTRRALEVRPDLFINYRLWNLAAVDDDADGGIVALVERAFGARLKKRVDVRWRKAQRVAGRLFLHFDTRFAWPRLDAPPAGDRGTCRALGDHFGILSDGTVVPCCLDARGAIALGNLNRRDITEILSGERCRRMASGFAQGRLEEDLCRRCTFIDRFRRKGAQAQA